MLLDDSWALLLSPFVLGIELEVLSVSLVFLDHAVEVVGASFGFDMSHVVLEFGDVLLIGEALLEITILGILLALAII